MMKSKLQILNSIRNLSADSAFTYKPLFYTDGRPDWADRWPFEGELEAHRGEIFQFYLISEPKPAPIKGATMIPVDTWWQADCLKRSTVNSEAYKEDTSFGYVLKTFQNDINTPRFVVVVYQDEKTSNI